MSPYIALSTSFGILALVVLSNDIATGTVYGVCLLILLIQIRGGNGRSAAQKAFLFLVGSAVLVSCFVRPAFLSAYPSLFKFRDIGVLTFSDLTISLIWATAFSLVFLVFYKWGLNLGSRKGGLTASRKWQFKIFCRPIFKFFIFVLAFLWLYLVFVTGYASKATESNKVLGLILPFNLLIPACLILSSKIATKAIMMRLFWFVLALLIAFAGVYRGSKAPPFLFLLIFFCLLYYDFAFVRGTHKIQISARSSFGLLIGVFSIIAGVYWANQFRWGVGEIIVRTVYHDSGPLPSEILFLLDVISKRLNVFDGLTVMTQFGDQIDRVEFSWANVFGATFAKLLPGVEGPPTMGVLVGREVNLMDYDVSYGGALGLFGAALIMQDFYGGMALVAIVAVCFGLLSERVAALPRGPEQLFAFILMVQLLASWLLSGNFDILMANLVMLLVQVVFYAVILGKLKRVA